MTPRVRQYAEEAGIPFGLSDIDVLRKHKPRMTSTGFTRHPAHEARKAVMLRLRRDGFKVTQIARWFKIDPSTVSYWTVEK